MKRAFPLLIFIFVLSILGCSKDSPTSSRVFTDSLTLGTGVYGIDLTQVATTFAITHNGDTVVYPTVYWRAESHTKMAGKDVTLKLDQITDFGTVNVKYFLFQQTGYDNYVAISSFYHLYGPGTFRATAMLGGDAQVLGTVQFTVTETK